MTEYIKCALRNLSRKRFRTWLTIASIAIGVASVVLISTIGDVGKEEINQELSSLGIGSLAISVDRQYGNLTLEQPELKAIREMTPVESAIPIMMEYSSLTMRGLIAGVAIWGVDAGANQIISLNNSYGDLFARSEVASGANVCLVDENTAQSFYGRENIVGKHLKLLLGGGYEDFVVSGVVESGGNAMQGMIGEYLPMFVYIPYTTLQRLSGRSGFDQIAVKVQDNREVEQAADEIVRGLEVISGVKGGFTAENIARQKDRLNALMNIVTNVLSAVAGISLVVAGLGIMTVMLVSVNERTREIGIKKSIGASRMVILCEFLTEAFTISALGSMIGTAIGISLAALGCAVFQIKLLLNLRMIVFAIGFAVSSGMVFGVYPSLLASKLKPVDALRHE